MPQIVGEVAVRVVPDFSQFKQKTAAFTKQMAGGSSSAGPASGTGGTASGGGVGSSGGAGGAGGLPSEHTMQFKVDTGGLKSAMGTIAEIAGVADVSTMAVNALASGVNMLKSTFMSFNETQQMVTVGLTTITGSVTMAKSALAEFNALALKSPFQYQDIIGWGQQLMAMGDNADQARSQLTALMDAASAMGNLDPGRMGSLVNIIGSSLSSGMISGESLSDLKAMGIPINQLLGNSNLPGVNPTTLQKGGLSLPTQEVLPYLMKALEGKYGGAAENAATGTWQGVMSNLKDVTGQLMGGGAGTAVFTQMTHGLSDVTNALENFKTSVGNVGLKQAIIDLFPASMHSTIAGLISDFAQIGPDLVKIGQVAGGQAFKELATAAGILAKALQLILAVGTPFLNFLAQQKTLVEGLVAAYTAYQGVMIAGAGVKMGLSAVGSMAGVSPLVGGSVATTAGGALSALALPAALGVGAGVAAHKYLGLTADPRRVSAGLKGEVNTDVNKVNAVTNNTSLAQINAIINGLAADGTAIHHAFETTSMFNRGKRGGYEEAAGVEEKAYNTALADRKVILEQDTVATYLHAVSLTKAGQAAQALANAMSLQSNLVTTLSGNLGNLNTAAQSASQALQYIAYNSQIIGGAAGVSGGMQGLTSQLATSHGQLNSSMMAAAAGLNQSGTTQAGLIMSKTSPTDPKSVLAGAAAAAAMFTSMKAQIDAAAQSAGLNAAAVQNLNQAMGVGGDSIKHYQLTLASNTLTTDQQNLVAKIKGEKDGKQKTLDQSAVEKDAFFINILNNMLNQMAPALSSTLTALNAYDPSANKAALQGYQATTGDKSMGGMSVAQSIGYYQGLENQAGGDMAAKVSAAGSVFQAQQALVSNAMAMTQNFSQQQSILQAAMSNVVAGSQQWMQYEQQAYQLRIQQMQYQVQTNQSIYSTIQGVVQNIDSMAKGFMGNSYAPYQLPGSPILGAGTLTQFANINAGRIGQWSSGLGRLQAEGLTQSAQDTLGLRAGPQELLQVQQLLAAGPAAIAKLNQAIGNQTASAQQEAWREQASIIATQLGITFKQMMAASNSTMKTTVSSIISAMEANLGNLNQNSINSLSQGLATPIAQGIKQGLAVLAGSSVP